MGGTTKLNDISLICATLMILAICMPKFDVCEAAGFSIDLIHRETLKSPNSLYTSSQQVKTMLQLSFKRAKRLVNHHHHSTQSVSSEIVSDNGEYLMKFSLGSSHVETLAIADTGSDLTWIQCKPCTSCFKQKAPLFEPNGSSTYEQVTCNSKECRDIGRTSCSGAKDTCGYTMSYGDRSYSRGDVATDTITLGNVSIPNVIIGCGHMNQGTFGAGASGIVGLGGGHVSLISQLGSSIGGKFSYCLVTFLGGKNPGPSKMSFGDQAVVSGGGAVTTPIVDKTPDTFYFLTLEGMTVGEERFDLSSSSSDVDEDYGASTEEGNIIIDSGTTLTFLPMALYYKVQAAVKKQMSVKEISDPAGLLNLCYLATGDTVKVPQITAHFKGADVKLKAANAFVKTTQSSLCFAFAPATSMAIYGNLAQMDFLVGYDLEKKNVSFKPTDCGKA